MVRRRWKPTKVIAMSSLFLIIVASAPFIPKFLWIFHPPPVAIPDDVRGKLSHSLIDVLAVTPSDIQIDTIVSYTGSWRTCLLEAENAIGLFTVLDHYEMLKGFHAFLYPDQIIGLARLDCIESMCDNYAILEPLA